LKRKGLAFGLILLFVAQLVGHQLAFVLVKHHAKSIIRTDISALQNKDLVQKITANQDLVWEEAGEEFSLHGSMYDIIGFDKASNSYLCIADTKETDIIQYYNHWLHSNNGDSAKKKNAMAALKWQTIECIVLCDNSKHLEHASTKIEIPNIPSLLTKDIKRAIDAPPRLIA